MSRTSAISSVALAVLGVYATAAAGMSLQSGDLPSPPARVALAQVYDANGCGGGNRSPQLRWSDAPAATRSFAVTIFDPDARAGRGWWHWVIYDIPAVARALPRGAGARGRARLDDGARQARNDFGDLGYDGPCPPPGAAHRYWITVYALDRARLSSDDVAATAVVAAIRRHALASARLTVEYGR